MSDAPRVRLDTIEALRLHGIVSLYFQRYIIPANELDWRAEKLAIQLGMEVKPRDQIRQEMGDSWATLLIRHITEELNVEPPPRRRCRAMENNATIEDRPGDYAMVCPMNGNVTNQPITCEWCGQTSTTRDDS